MGYPYEDQLKDELVELGKTKEKLDGLKKDYEDKRNRVQKWLEVNKLSSHEVTDNNGNDWQIKFEPRRNRRIIDHNLLKVALGDDYSTLVNEFESSVFKVGRKNIEKKK